MSHPIHFPNETKRRLSSALNDAVRKVDFSNYGYEPNFTPALVQQLHGFEFDDGVVKITFEGVAVVSMVKGSAEKWSGADMSIVANIAEPNGEVVKKGTLIQSKVGKVERLNDRESHRLIEQIKDMQALTEHPKVLEIFPDNHCVTIVSGAGFLEGRRLQHPTFGDWIARRVLPTFDGDKDPSFVKGVLDARLSSLRIHARKK